MLLEVSIKSIGSSFLLSRVIFLVRVLDTFVFSGYDGNTITNLISPSGGKKIELYQKFLLTCALI